MLKLGWKAGPEQYPPDELLEQVVEAEKAGFETVDVSDHFSPWSPEGQAAFVWTWLGAAAARTKTIELGPGVTCPILRYHPAVIAQAAATLEYMAPDRVYLGVGTGEALNEYAATGLWPTYSERQDRLRESIELIRRLWSGEDVTHKGTYYETDKARLWTLSGRKIPLYISAMVPASAYFAGQFGDGIFTVGGQEPDLYKRIIEQFEQGAREAGKDPATMPKLIELNVAYTDDADAALAEMKKYWASTFLPALFTHKIYTPQEAAKNGEMVGVEVMKEKMCVSSKTEDHVQYAQQHIDLGFTHLYFHSPGPDQIGFLRSYGKEVLPAIRKGAESGKKELATAGT
jgi:coenzyme F420-dependent glucose-6-phosphate dehydrogenase